MLLSVPSVRRSCLTERSSGVDEIGHRLLMFVVGSSFRSVIRALVREVPLKMSWVRRNLEDRVSVSSDGASSDLTFALGEKHLLVTSWVGLGIVLEEVLL